MNAGLPSDRVLLEHISECIDRILEYTAGDRATFDASRMVQDAVIRNLQTLAESTQRLSATIKDTEQDVSWRAIAGFRNVLAHDYLHIDQEVVWSVVEGGSAGAGFGDRAHGTQGLLIGMTLSVARLGSVKRDVHGAGRDEGQCSGSSRFDHAGS